MIILISDRNYNKDNNVNNDNSYDDNINTYDNNNKIMIITMLIIIIEQ